MLLYFTISLVETLLTSEGQIHKIAFVPLPNNYDSFQQLQNMLSTSTPGLY